MPTPIQVTKYCCNICGYAYSNYNTAIMCESATMVPEHEVLEPGTTISFEAEDITTKLVEESGTILVKIYLTTKNPAGFFEHHIAYLVKCHVDGDDWEERVVFWSDGHHGNKVLYAPYELRYKKGYHLNMPGHLRIPIQSLTQA